MKHLYKKDLVKYKQTENVLNEKQVLTCSRFPFLLYSVFTRKDYDYLYLGLPFINGGELFTHHKKMKRFNEDTAKFYGSQVFLGLDYLHNSDIVYRDLKTENIMVTHKGYLKITDFGFSKRVEGRTLTLCGTPEYIAPEMIQAKPYGSTPDWWAYGVLVYEFVAGHTPFVQFASDPMKMYEKICECDYKCPSFFSPPLKDLVSNLLQVDVTKRCICNSLHVTCLLIVFSYRFGNLKNGRNDIKNHEWYNGYDWFGTLNQEITAPFVPKIQDELDTSNFDKQKETKLVKSKTNQFENEFADF